MSKIKNGLFASTPDISGKKEALYFGASEVVIKPIEFQGAIRNPLKGFRPYLDSDTSEATNPKPAPNGHEFGCLRRHYIKWNDIEDTAQDSLEKITQYCNKAWNEVERYNIKVIPRVYLQWNNDSQQHWPSDMKQGDWNSDQFKERLKGLMTKLGQAWDNDPRVAYIEMGIYGKWGEHHSPEIPPDIMKIMGDGFKLSFKNKCVMQRQPSDFQGNSYGIYWDSFAHADQTDHGEAIFQLGDRWKESVMGGECAYDWGNWHIQPGLDANASVSHPEHRDYIRDLIRKLHTNHLGWIDQYNQSDDVAGEGAAVLQKVMGYRFVIEEMKYTAKIEPGGKLITSFLVKNIGSSPFYYIWPVEISLIKESTKQVVWKEKFDNLDIRGWLPGDDWDPTLEKYAKPAKSYVVEGEFSIPSDIPKGEYILALAILDPAGELPSVRFAVKNYYLGGRHPIGKIGIGVNISDPVLTDFDEMEKDWSLHYLRL